MSKLTPFALVALSGLAAADPQTKDKPAPANAKLEVPKLEAPKPPAEIDAMSKSVVGTWKCTGTTTTMAGAAEPMTAKVIAKVDLDKWWISDVVEGKSTRGPFKMVSYSTFDAASKKWRRVSIDNMGTNGAGQFKDSVDPSDAKTGTKFTGVMSVDKGKTWKPVYEMTCKK